MKNYEINKAKARELFKTAIDLKKNNPEGLPMWKLNSRLGTIISEMDVLGYKTTIEDIGYESEGGRVWELENLKLLHKFTEVLKIETTSIGYADYFKIYNKLASMEMGETCRTCKGSGLYKLASGSNASCAVCNGTGRSIEVDEYLLKDISSVTF